MCETSTKKAIVLGTFLMSLCIFQCFGAVFEDMEDGRTATIICDGFLGFIHSLLVIGAFQRQRQNILSGELGPNYLHFGAQHCWISLDMGSGSCIRVVF